jgi:hypothetical protein
MGHRPDVAPSAPVLERLAQGVAVIGAVGEEDVACQALRPPLQDEINKLQQKYRERTSNNSPYVILTGHSFGGALA